MGLALVCTSRLDRTGRRAAENGERTLLLRTVQAQDLILYQLEKHIESQLNVKVSSYQNTLHSCLCQCSADLLTGMCDSQVAALKGIRNCYTTKRSRRRNRSRGSLGEVDIDSSQVCLETSSTVATRTVYHRNKVLQRFAATSGNNQE